MKCDDLLSRLHISFLIFFSSIVMLELCINTCSYINVALLIHVAMCCKELLSKVCVE